MTPLPHDPALSARLMRRATWASVTVALVLIAAKTTAWLVTGSVAMLASLADSLLDGLASVVTLLAVRHALTPADAEHRFGHGKAEALAGLGQAVLVTGSALFLAVEAVQRLLDPQPVRESAAGIAVMLLSIVLTVALVLYQRRVVRQTGSLAISADRLHYVGDLLANLAVIAALVVGSQGDWAWFDPVCALVIAAVLLKSAIDIVRGALNHLMDRELDDDARWRIRQAVLAHRDVKAMHDLRTRRSGMQTFIQLHVELDAEISLREAHRISDAIEMDLLKLFPGAEVIIHQDPAGVAESQPPFDTLGSH